MLPSFFDLQNHHKTLIFLLKTLNSLRKIKQIHAHLITSNLISLPQFPSHLLLASTTLSTSPHYPHLIFTQISTPSVRNWSMIIRAHSGSPNPNRSISLYVEMVGNGVRPEYMTYPFVIKAAARVGEVGVGGAVHCGVLRTGLEADRFVGNALVHMYGSFGVVREARKVFDGMSGRNVVSWNSMLDGYMKCGEMEEARGFFEAMGERDVVSWSCLIDGLVKGGEYEQALEVFGRMRGEGPKANEVTMVSVLCACAHLGALEQGRSMVRYMVENGLPMTLILQTAAMDMYAKCGAMEEAMAVFRAVPKTNTDVFFWNTIIGGLANHGHVRESLNLFGEMQNAGVTPDEITFLSLLSACAHGGLVDEAWHFLESLERHGMMSKSEHYACMVDALARAGRITEAYEFLKKMPGAPSASTLGALLSGCTNHKRFDIAEKIGKRLIELEPHNDGRYVGLSNVYAFDKRWHEARKLREAMETVGVKKSPGFSLVEVSGELHRFVAHDKLHPLSYKIYEMLSFVVKQTRGRLGYDDQESNLYYAEILVK